jgi:AcrR family transcriptional regulator
MDRDAPAPEPAPAVDGRNRRRARNIDVVVDAMLQLLGEGRAWPSAADIAARAGLSERSVYRYFEDLDALARAAVETQVARADHLFQPQAVASDPADPADSEASLEARIDRLVDHRVAMYDEVGPIVHAAGARATLHPAIAEGLAHRRRQLRAQLRALFAPELAAADEAGEPGASDDLLAALEVVTGFEALHSLRVDQGRSAARTRRILRRAVAALLA